jgi:putative hydrolase
MDDGKREVYKSMNIVADLHTHTLVSNHAFNTITEMAHGAAQRGMFAFAVTDHAPAMPDSPHPWYFYNLTTLPPQMEGVWVLKGMEANVSDVAGTLDFTADEMKRFALDWVIASLHTDVIGRSLSWADATQLWLNVAENPYVDMIGHSEERRFAYDYDLVTKEFARRGKVVELNANSAVVRPGSEENLKLLALACKKNETPIAVNTDAHAVSYFGKERVVLQMLQEIEFPPELVVNSSVPRLLQTLRAHNSPIIQWMEDIQ